MEIILAIVAFVLLVLGLCGAFAPAIPGPPLSYAGLSLLQWSGYASFSSAFLWLWLAITAAVTVMDNFLPALMTKKFGGSRMAVFGSVLGLVVGVIFFPPVGLLAGPFLGALSGELINNRIQAKRGGINSGGNVKALKVAFGAFLAFIVGTGAKLIVSSLMIYYAVKAAL
jgi:uncharacterized protein YqgC (DUF456 family)